MTTLTFNADSIELRHLSGSSIKLRAMLLNLRRAYRRGHVRLK